MHRDYQGSILAITNDAGSVLEKRKFDAWGSLIQLEQNGVLTPLPSGGAGGGIVLLLDRGYTGHEHLQSVGLINMNGRLYDPKLHRFLQPDNFIQDPMNTQNYNRYGYVLNNPLKYTDPTGEFTWSDLFAAVAIVVGVVVVIASGGTLTPVAQWLIGAGAAHFLGTFAMYANNGYKDWDSASNYIGLQSPSISINVDSWFDGKSDKNGITQNDPAVTPKSDTDGNSGNGGSNGNGGGQGWNLSPAQQAQIKAREHHYFFGAEIKFNAYQSGKDVYNSTYFGTIHTSRPTFNDYLMKGVASDGGSTLMHEYGHYLHAQHAPLNFYSYAMWSSAWTANSSSPMSNWTEITANTMAYYYFGQPSFWRQNENPINSNYLSKQTIFQLTHHLPPFNRFKP